MGNMSYCRFENTYGDLQDCYDALAEKSLDELSETEKKYAIKLIKMCRDIANDFLDEAEGDE
jgi:phage host-nuclease inhibitor protein Gam